MYEEGETISYEFAQVVFSSNKNNGSGSDSENK